MKEKPESDGVYDPNEHGHLTLAGLMEEIERDSAARRRLEEYGRMLDEATTERKNDPGIER